MSKRELRKLAKLIFRLSRREVWLGGRTERKRIDSWTYETVIPGWPEKLDKPKWKPNLTWTLSPEVELGGQRMRVCVSWLGDYGEPVRVRVFADDKVRYPGGWYDHSDWWLWTYWFPSWEVRIAEIERRDGGSSGPIDRRDLLIAEAKEKLELPRTNNKLLITKSEEPEAAAAIAEVEALMRRAGERQRQ